MLDKETLLANEALATLTDEQVTAIETLSKNDESAVIGKRIGEIYRQMDETIAAATGIARNGDEKTYVYLERAAKEYAEANKGDLKKIQDLEKEKARLEKALEESAPQESERKIRELRADLAEAKKQYAELSGKYDSMEKAHAGELAELRVDWALEQAASGCKLKEAFPESVRSMIRKGAIDSVKKSYTPSFDDEGRLVFRDADGAVVVDKKNMLEPVTAAVLLENELKKMDALDDGKRKNGAGTRTVTIPSASYRTKSEALEEFRKIAADKGLIAGSYEHQAEIDRLCKENDYDKLPN